MFGIRIRSGTSLYGVLPGIIFGPLSGVLSGVLSNLSDIHLAFCLDLLRILSGTNSDIESGILPGMLSLMVYLHIFTGFC